MPVVTMSGNLASGVREVGEMAARLLGVDFVDQQLMARAAQRCGVSVGAVAEHDERYASFRERFSGVIKTFLERSAAASAADPMIGATGLEALLSLSYADLTNEQEGSQLTDQVYLETMTALVRELGAVGGIVILGRGSQMILSDMSSALHVLCVAPKKLRARRLADREGIGLEEALNRTAESDRARAAFYKKFWKVEVEDPKLYDLTIDTSRLSFDAAAEIAATAARLKASTPAAA